MALHDLKITHTRRSKEFYEQAGEPADTVWYSTPKIELDGEFVKGLFSVETLHHSRVQDRVKLIFKASKLEVLYNDDHDRKNPLIPAPVAPDHTDFDAIHANITIIFNRPYVNENRRYPFESPTSGFGARIVVNGKPLLGVTGFEIKSKPLDRPTVEVEMIVSSMKVDWEISTLNPELVSI
jgi:hypothetical protein